MLVRLSLRFISYILTGQNLIPPTPLSQRVEAKRTRHIGKIILQESILNDVKKELRGKYKRHYWQDDPFTAQATSKTKKQMNRE